MSGFTPTDCGRAFPFPPLMGCQEVSLCFTQRVGRYLQVLLEDME